MSTASEIETSVADIVKAITFKSVQPDEALISSHLLDSIGIVDLVVEIEQRFGVAIDLQQVNPREFDTVQQIARDIAGRVGA